MDNSSNNMKTMKPGGPFPGNPPPGMHGHGGAGGHPPILTTIPGVDFPVTAAIAQHPDLAYAAVSPAQKLDLYLPQGAGPFPLVLLIHGGGFMLGDKADPMSKAGTDQLLEHGYAVAVVNYRLSGEAKAPAQIWDVKTAVRWLRAHAGEYHLDAGRFGAWGGSAGGNLVALLGTSCGVQALEGFELGCPTESSEIQAVVDWFGPVDFLLMDQQFAGSPDAQTHDAPDSPESALIGAPIQTRPDLVKAINPITYISPSAAPFLIQHGTADRLVPPGQSQMLHDALLPVLGKEKVTLTLLQDAPHGGGPRFWSSTNLETVFGFLDKHLKDRSASEGLLEKGAQVNMDGTYQANMAAGPRIFSFRRNMNFYGAIHNLTIGEQDRGKTLQVEVDTGSHPVCWIELWPGHYEGDWVNWTTDRGQEALMRSGSQPQPNPAITWKIEPGKYALYFVASSRTREVSDTLITYHLKTT